MVHPRLEEVLKNREHGASEIERRLVERLLELAAAGGAPESAWNLEELTRAVLSHQPAMANLLQLLNRLWLAWEEAFTDDLPWRRLAETLEERRQAMGHQGGEVGAGLQAALASRSVVFTLSRSGTVLEGLVFLHRQGHSLRVVVGEGRPRREGLLTARELAGRGIETWVAVDGALPAMVRGGSSLPLPFSYRREEGTVVVGADALGPRAFVNKVGTWSLVMAGREAGIPAWVVASEEKLLPEGLFSCLRIEGQDPGEVAEAGDVGRINFYFEEISLDLVTGVVMGGSFLSPQDLRLKAGSLKVSPGLQHFLEHRPIG